MRTLVQCYRLIIFVCTEIISLHAVANIPYFISKTSNLSKYKPEENYNTHNSSQPSSFEMPSSGYMPSISSGRNFTFQESVDLHFSNEIFPMPLGQTEAERHYINVKLWEKELKAQKDRQKKVLKAHGEKAIIGSSIIIGLTILGTLLRGGLMHSTGRYENQI